MLLNLPAEIFFSYSHKDEHWRESIELVLKPLVRRGVISIWHNRLIAGEDWSSEIDNHLDRAQIILLLISPNYLASEYCYDKEMVRAMERHESGEAIVIPIILRPSDWQQSPFGKLMAFPRGGEPLSTLSDPEAVLVKLTREIQLIIDKLNGSYPDSQELTGSQNRRIFISYSHRDVEMLGELKKYLVQLERESVIKIWDDTMIPLGSEWGADISLNLNVSDIIVLLISPNYFASAYLYDIELSRALERYSAGEVKILPVMLEKTELSNSRIAQFVQLPRGEKPVKNWDERNDAWIDVVRGIRNTVYSSQETTHLIASTPDVTDPPADQLTSSEAVLNPVVIPEASAELEIIEIGKIFATVGVPSWNYEEPREFRDLLIELPILGKGLVIEGPSGIGKTSIVRRAIESFQSFTPVEWILATDEQVYEQLNLVLSQGHFKGYIVIDDFHHLTDEYKDRIARAIKFQSEQNPPDSKIIVIGINQVQQMLLEGFPELAGRVRTLRIEKQSDDKIQAMIEKGERAANITFRSRAEIAEIAEGSFFTAQLFCYSLAVKANIDRTQKERKIIEDMPHDALDKVLDMLNPKYKKSFSEIAKIDADHALKGAGLVLLRLLAIEGNYDVSISEAKNKYPSLSHSFDRLMAGGLQRSFDKNPSLKKLFFYDSRTRLLVFEDPQFAFYLRHIPWVKYARDAGHRIEISENDELIFKDLPRNKIKILNWSYSFFTNMKDIWDLLPNPAKIFIGFGLFGLAAVGVIQSNKFPWNEPKVEPKKEIEVQFIAQDVNGNVLPDVEIQLTGEGPPLTCYTNTSGYCPIKTTPRKDANITLKKEGYDLKSEAINFSTDLAGNKVYRLNKKKEKPKN